MVEHWVDDDGVGRVHLNDPGRRNALSKELSDALADGVASLDAGAIVLTAEAPVFCSGHFALELEAQQWSVDRPGFVNAVRRVQERLARRD